MSDPEARRRRVESAIGERRGRVNDAIPEWLPIEEPTRLHEASRYLLDAGGKRLRPVMLLLVAEALSGERPPEVDYRSMTAPDGTTIDAMAPALSVETIQSFTLIHDDIMDDDDLRRGVPAVHESYDLETAILAGDTLYAKAFGLMTRSAAPHERTVRAVRTLSETCVEICEGQSMDVSFEDRDDVSPEEYLRMVELKTAMLYAAAASIPAVLMGADDEVVDAMFGYGLDVGRAFQIRDDVLDLTVPSERLGKQRGSDLVEEKKTLISVHAREHGVAVEDLVATEDVEAVTEAEIDDAVERLREVGSIEYANDRAREFVDRGTERLETLPENGARDLLADLAEYLVERGY